MRQMICRLVVVVSLVGFACAQAGEMSELEKRNEFAKAYAAAKPEDRVAAVQLLKGAKEDASFLYLVRVANVDVDPAVRLSAYNLISEWEDPMGRMEKVLLGIFLNEKNRDNKVSMCKLFPQLKTKTAATRETIKFFNTFTYPETTDRRDRDWDNIDLGAGGGGGGGGTGGTLVGRRSNESIAQARKDFTEVLAIVNALTGQSFAASNKARDEIKRWWTMNQADLMKADAATLKKLEDEARAAATKATAAADKRE